MAFTNMVKNFLGNKKADDYKELVGELCQAFRI